MSRQVREFCETHGLDKSTENVVLDMMDDILYYTELTPVLYDDLEGGLSVRVYHHPEECIDISSDDGLPDVNGFVAIENGEDILYAYLSAPGEFKHRIDAMRVRNQAVRALCDIINEVKFHG